MSDSKKPTVTRGSSPWKRSIATMVPENDKMFLKAALYNTAMLVFVGLCVGAVITVYFLLHQFIRPILWAALAGTVVFPLKRRVTVAVKSWLRNLKSTSTPLIVGVAWIPINITDYVAETLWQIVSSKLIFLIIAYPIMVMFGRYKLFSTLLLFLGDIWVSFDEMIVFLTDYWMYPILVLYAAGYLTWIKLLGIDISNNILVKVLSIPMWFITCCFIAQLFGPFNVAVFLVMVCLVILGAVGFIGDSSENDNQANAGDTGAKTSNPIYMKGLTYVNEQVAWIEQKIKEQSGSVDQSPSFHSPSRTYGENGLFEPRSSPSSRTTGGKLSVGDTYLQTLFGACVLLYMATHLWLMKLMFIPLIYMVLKRIGEYIGVTGFLTNKCSAIWSFVKEKCQSILKPATPTSVKNLVKMIFSCDQKVIDGLYESMNILSTIIAILIVVLVAVFLVIFVGFQLYGESMNMIAISQKLANHNISGDNYVVDLAEGMIGQDFEIFFQNGINYTRTYLKTQVRKASKGNKNKTRILVDHVDILMNDIEKMNVFRNLESTAADPADSAGVTGDEDVSNEGISLMGVGKDLFKIVKVNGDYLRNVAGSLFTLKANYSVVGSVLFDLWTIVFDLGGDILEFVLSIIVFFIVLYYLLVSSKSQWKPLSWLSKLIPRGGDMEEVAEVFTTAVENTISGVFTFSTKMAFFYGFYVWFIHSLFNISIVFIPSAVASILAVVPLFGASWVFIPGFLELWWIGGDIVLAAIFGACHFIPMFFVDDAFYEELKGSHPYVTGLAVVGGACWMGMEGAILGPLILCCMIVLLKMMYGLLWTPSPASGTLSPSLP